MEPDKDFYSENSHRCSKLLIQEEQNWFGENDDEIQKFLKSKPSSHTRLPACSDNQTCKAAYRKACNTPVNAESDPEQLVAGQAGKISVAHHNR